MKRLVILLVLFIFSTTISLAQEYFVPVVGGLENAKNGKDYYLVEMQGIDSLQIYDALLTMVKEKFNGSEDEIIETIEGNYIKVRGFSKNALCSQHYDSKTQVEFNIKNNRYIFKLSKFNIEASADKGSDRIVFQKGSGMSSVLTDGKTYLFNKKGKIAIRKSCYKSIIRRLDALGKMFDISDEYEKYAAKNKDADSGW